MLRTDIVVARLLVMCIFLPDRLQVLASVGACVYFVFRTLGRKEWPPRQNFIAALALGSSFLLYIGAALITPASHRREAFSLCERMLSFLLMPFVFAIMSQYFRQLIAGQLRYFVYGCIIVSAMGIADFFYHHFIVNGGKVPMSHVELRNIFENFTGIHPTYMGVYLGFAICITGIMWEPASKRQAMLKNVTIYTLLLFLLSLFAKSPIIALGIIAIHFLYERRGQLRRFAVPGAVLAGVVGAACAFIPFVRQRAGEMLGLFGENTEDDLIQNSVHMRRLIWNTDVTLLKHYWLTGIGPGRLLEALHLRYFFHSLYSGYWVGYFDPHNQYLSHWLSFGIPGILVLVITLIIHLRRAVAAGNRLYLYLLFIIVITFFTETMLARQQGVLFYSIFTALFFFLYSPSPALPTGRQAPPRRGGKF
ncbi:O-antigen ligase family protein [Nemorincola caseinilytica]|uniref:O-antigen ligase family protein n=1 Tax=Nemorincola caseinilytica TaxID=2054315 RepID=UPI0031EF07A1